VSDIDTGVVDSLKALDPDGRLEKRTNSRHLGTTSLAPVEETAGSHGFLPPIHCKSMPGVISSSPCL